MSRASVGRRVARAAATGAGRRKSGQTPTGWYGAIVLIVVVGIGLVYYSRYEAQNPNAGPAPTIGTTWLAAYGIDVCGKFDAPLAAPKNESSEGITTSGNGLITIAPTTSADAGHNATLGRFVENYPGFKLTSDTLGIPSGKTWSNGDKCGTKPGQVMVESWSSLAASGQVASGNPGSLRLANQQLITIAFEPAGTALAKPPSAGTLITAATTTTTSTTLVPTTLAPTTTAPATTTTTGKATTTTSAGTTSTTTARSTTTTTRT